MMMILMTRKFDNRKHLTQGVFMITDLLLIWFDELHLCLRNVCAKYILVNDIFTLVMFGERKLGLSSLSYWRL